MELNAYHLPQLREMAAILVLQLPPYRNPPQIHEPLDRSGHAHAEVNPSGFRPADASRTRDSTLAKVHCHFEA